MNLFELFVKIGVDDQASGNLKSIGQKLGNGLKTAAKVGTAAVGLASAAITALTTQAVNSFAEYEQLAGGAQKIFNQMDYSKIATDAKNAYKELGLSASQYLAVINDVGATFAATMGDEAGYEAAKTGLKAISDYASGTGKNVDELSQKFTLITRSTSSYQSIADQFSGILPATSSAFLEQAQAAGILSDSYTQLTEVPIDEYQAAVSQMLQQGVTDLGLADNTVKEAFSTLSGSLSMAKGAWNNLVTGLADDSADLDVLLGNFVESVGAVAENLVPKIVTTLKSSAKLIKEFAPQIAKELPKLMEEILPDLASATTSLIVALSEQIPSMAQTFVDAAYQIVDEIGNAFAEKIPGLSIIFENLETVVIALTAAFTALKASASISALIGALTTSFQAYQRANEGATVAQWAMNAAMNANPFVLVATLIAGVVAAIITLWNTNEGFRESVIKVWEGIKSAFSSAWNFVVDLWGQAGDFFANIWSGIKKAFGAVTDWFQNTFSKAWTAVKNVFSAGGKIFTGIKEGIEGVFKTVVNAIIRGINTVISIPFNAINKMLRTLRDVSILGLEPFGWIKEFSVPKIPELWRGGVLERGQIGLLEGSGAEAVVPLENNKKWISKVAKDMKNQLNGKGQTFGGNGVYIVQHIHSEAKTAADLMIQARYQAEQAVFLSV